jgi:arsenite-transporting ATPase
VLVVSTDPAHSLGDALAVRLSSRVSRVVPGLDGIELDAPRAFARWLHANRSALRDILEHGTWLDRGDVDTLLELSMPGVDELMAMLEIGDLAAPLGGVPTSSGSHSDGPSARYDLVVVDTAPTGHTLRLLAAPETVAAVAGTLDSLQREHRLIRAHLARSVRPEAADRLIDLLSDQARRTHDLLRDRTRTTFRWVMLAEELSLAETDDALSTIEAASISVPELIVNRLLPAGVPCPTCDGRRAAEQRILARAERTIGKERLVRVVPAQMREPRGVAALSRVGRHLWRRASGRSAIDTNALGRRAIDAKAGLRRERRGTAAASFRSDRSVPAAFAAFRKKRLLFVGGKGGVGKTTIAAATAIALALDNPRKRVLLLSTDPAHSIGDVLGAVIGDRPTSVPGAPRNLRARELDAAAALRKKRAVLEAALSEVVATVGASRDQQAGLNGLIELTPPGVDELFGILAVAAAGAERRDRPDVIVVDTAPTGHALRLFEAPEIARDWVRTLMQVLLKYRTVVRPGGLGAELVELARSIRLVQTLIRDPDRSGCIIVTRAAAVPRIETERVLGRLESLHIAVPAVVVNARTLEPGKCPWCARTALAERRELETLITRVRRLFGRNLGSREGGTNLVIIQTALIAPPPRGVAMLRSWAGTWKWQPLTRR